MAEQPSEEKSLPASDKKLRDAREKGQVDKSNDMVTAVGMLGCTLYLLVSAGTIEARVRSLITLTTRLYQEPFDAVWPRLMAAGLEVLVYSVLPLIIITVVAAILTNILIMRGTLFSIEPIKPKFEHINPAEGVKRIFSVRGIIEFFKSLLKIVTLGTAFVVVCRLGLQALMESARCGVGCLEGIFLALLKPLVITALVVFLIIGLIDVRMQRWLFRRDQRMTRTEYKRERKDMEGDPEIRKARRRQRRDVHAVSTRTGVEQASIMIGAGGDWLVGIRYVRGETPVPVVVCKATPEDSAWLRRKAYEHELAVVENRELAGRIGRRAGNGEPVPDDTFQPVADILVAANL
ncbi:EscU/YscU/HrcU family type III secretion system export apparatus switch protein, partial [Halomonas elongata]|uniref:EscU/YscU/HrcU family type III secretion system export apparatus switch protein n=1 Tax=Halomonas elongata TaxID=2746 RepID=UPI0038D4E802